MDKDDGASETPLGATRRRFGRGGSPTLTGGPRQGAWRFVRVLRRGVPPGTAFITVTQKGQRIALRKREHLAVSTAPAPAEQKRMNTVHTPGHHAYTRAVNEETAKMNTTYQAHTSEQRIRLK